jgi:hypothetical protein
VFLPSLVNAEDRTTVDRLKSIPGVVSVTVRSAKQPTHRLIHILDWHYVPKKQFLLDTPEGDYEAFLNDVEALQEQQRALIKAIGVKAVFLEGLTADTEAHYAKRIATLKKYKPPTGDDPIDLFVAQLRREDALQLGAPGAMLVAGELDAVLPADDPELHRASDPVTKDGIEMDAEANEAREDGIAGLLFVHPLAVVVLGGEHGLADILPASVECVRVALSGYQRAESR